MRLLRTVAMTTGARSRIWRKRAIVVSRGATFGCPHVGCAAMERFICVACGTQFSDAPEPPPSCAVCEDPRQYLPPEGQRWTTLAALAAGHGNAIRDEADLVGIGTEPKFAIGQRALLVPFGASNLLWDCVTLLDDPTAAAVDARGGLAAIAISHPHYYSAMVEWAHRFDCP